MVPFGGRVLLHLWSFPRNCGEGAAITEQPKTRAPGWFQRGEIAWLSSVVHRGGLGLGKLP